MIIITGMQRSGTSAISNLLLELGIKFPDSKELLPGNKWNARGHFEPRDLRDLNEQIITGFNRQGSSFKWFLNRLVYWVFQPSRQAIERRAVKFKSKIEQSAQKYASMAVKVPAFCCTLKFWKAVADIERYVVCLRYPEESVLSLKRRQKFPLKAPLWMGYRFWDFNISALLEELPVERTLFVNYNCLLSDDYFDELSMIRKFFELPLSDEEMVQSYRKVFDPKLYQNRAGSKNRLPAKTRKLWERLLDLREQARERITATQERES